MRTKTLLFAAAVIAGGIATSTAQTVYSQNIVGYVNLISPSGYKMISNPLQTTNNDVSFLFKNPQNQTTIYKRNATGTGYDQSIYDTDIPGWTDPMTLNPGEGAFILIPGPLNYTNTFIGEVQLNSTNPIPTGFSIRASALAQGGGLQSVLGIPVSGLTNATIYRYNPGSGYAQSILDPDVGWTPSEPTPSVGESFWILNPNSPTNWIRNFSVSF